MTRSERRSDKVTEETSSLIVARNGKEEMRNSIEYGHTKREGDGTGGVVEQEVEGKKDDRIGTIKGRTEVWRLREEGSSESKTKEKWKL